LVFPIPCLRRIRTEWGKRWVTKSGAQAEKKENGSD